MIYLLDTCTLSHFARRQPQVLAQFAEKPVEQLAVSVVTAFEVEYGLRSNIAAEQRVGRLMRAVLSSVRQLSFDEVCALRAAEIRARLRALGRPIGAYDLLIAATAMAHDLKIVTSNIREFSQIEGCVAVDWCC